MYSFYEQYRPCKIHIEDERLTRHDKNEFRVSVWQKKKNQFLTIFLVLNRTNFGTATLRSQKYIFFVCKMLRLLFTLLFLPGLSSKKTHQVKRRRRMWMMQTVERDVPFKSYKMFKFWNIPLCIFCCILNSLQRKSIWMECFTAVEVQTLSLDWTPGWYMCQWETSVWFSKACSFW